MAPLDLITQSLPNESPAGHIAKLFSVTWLARKERHLGLSEGQRDRKTNPRAHSKCNTEEAKKLYMYLCYVIISLINNWLAVIMLTINYQNG